MDPVLTKRNMFHCLIDLIDTSTNKIIFFSIKEKSFSNIQDFRNDPRFMDYCHDHDAKTRKVFEDSGWELQEFVDRNHAIKKYDRIYSEVCSEHKGRLLSDNRQRLICWLVHIIYLDESAEVKQASWKRSYFHYI